ncbi:MAG: hypothetical protein IH991_19530, partial [Planctomycetes bacterium]|nr:hypothetical protein [Planctomycetota bacterium]
MKCPRCDFALADDDLRCRQCGAAVTFYKNLREFAAQSHAAGLQLLSQGDIDSAGEWLLRAVIFAPDEPLYLDNYARALGQQGRFQEAAYAFEQLNQISPTPESQAACQLAQRLSQEPSSDGRS